jgi:hypothetical protein
MTANKPAKIVILLSQLNECMKTLPPMRRFTGVDSVAIVTLILP